jgi:hypothetical protein
MSGLLTALFFSSLVATATFAPRGRLTLVSDQVVDCSDIVEQVLAKSGGRLLSVRPQKDRCTVVMLVHEDGKRPHKVVVRVDYPDTDADAAK